MIAHAFIKLNRSWLVSRFGRLAVDPWDDTTDIFVGLQNNADIMDGPSAGAVITGE